MRKKILALSAIFGIANIASYGLTCNFATPSGYPICHGEDVFLIYDDFNGLTLDKTKWAVGRGSPYIGSGALRSSTDYGNVISTVGAKTPFVLETRSVETYVDAYCCVEMWVVMIGSDYYRGRGWLHYVEDGDNNYWNRLYFYDYIDVDNGNTDWWGQDYYYAYGNHVWSFWIKDPHNYNIYNDYGLE